MRKAALEGNKLSETKLTELVKYASNPYIDTLISRNDFMLIAKPLDQWKRIVQSIADQPHIECCKTIEQHDKKINAETKELKNFDFLLKQVNDAEVSINHCQASTAKHCVTVSEDKKRSLWRVGAGLGKSHLIMLISLILLKLEHRSTIYIVFSSEDLQKKDEHLIEIATRLS